MCSESSSFQDFHYQCLQLLHQLLGRFRPIWTVQLKLEEFYQLLTLITDNWCQIADSRCQIGNISLLVVVNGRCCVTSKLDLTNNSRPWIQTQQMLLTSYQTMDARWPDGTSHMTDWTSHMTDGTSKMTDDRLYMADGTSHDRWHITLDRWHITYGTSQMIDDSFLITLHRGRKTVYRWQTAVYRWHIIEDSFQMIHYRW